MYTNDLYNTNKNHEIQSAIEAVHIGLNNSAAIRELPVLPEFEYVHTCGFCGSHNTPTRIISEAGMFRVCSWCQHRMR